MSIKKRNYIPGNYEAFTNEPIGTPVLNEWTPFSLDGLFNFDVADIVLYQDGVALPEGTYELKKDATYTARESNYSGKTLYKMFRITNASYAGIDTAASGNNFGSAVDNELLYSLSQQALVYERTEYTEDAGFTTPTDLFRSLHVFGSLTEDATFTITDGGGDERNRFTVKNNDDTYKVIVSGDKDYWVEPGQSVEFYILSGTLVWASAGWEVVDKDLSRIETNFSIVLDDGAEYEVYLESTTSNRTSTRFTVNRSLSDNRATWDPGYNIKYTISTNNLSSTLSGWFPRVVRKWHDAA